MLLLNSRDARGPKRLAPVFGRFRQVSLPWLFWAALLSGCPDGESDSSRDVPLPDDAGSDVHIAVPSGLELPSAWQVAVSEWEATSGAHCTIEEVDWSRSGQGLPPDSATLAVAPFANLAELLDAGWPAPISDDSPASPLAHEVFGGLRRSLAVANGDPVGIPVACPVLACYYRADLLEAAGLTPPVTWDDYASLVEALPDWAPGLTAVEPWSEGFRASMFLARAVPAALHPDNYSLYLDVETCEPLIGEPPFAAALEESIRILPMLDPRSRELGPAECVGEILAGRAALAVGSPESQLPTYDNSVNSVPRAKNDMRIGVTVLPGAARVYQRQSGEWQSPPDGATTQRVTLIGFDGWLVCAAARSDPEFQSAGWHLWTTLDALHIGGSSHTWAGALVQTSQLADVLQRPLPGFQSDEWRAHVQATAESLTVMRTAFDLPLPERDRFRDLLTQQVSAAIAGEQSAVDALQSAKEGWDTLLDQLGRGRVLNVYRRCNGLSPLPEP